MWPGDWFWIGKDGHTNLYGYGGIVQQIAFNITAFLVLNLRPGKVSHTLQQDYYPLIEGMFSLPIDLPWTIYGKAVKVNIQLSVY